MNAGTHVLCFAGQALGFLYAYSVLYHIKRRPSKCCKSKRDANVDKHLGTKNELASRADQRVLIWFGHVERMDEYCMATRVLMAKVSGGRVHGRPRLGWMDGVKVALGNRGMTVQDVRQCAKDRRAWRALVHM